MGHTAGIAQGFAILALIVFGVIAIAGGASMVVGLLVGNSLVTASLAGLSVMGVAYLLYQTRYTCLQCGMCGILGGLAAAWLSWPGVLGTLVGIVAGVIVTFVAMFAIICRFPEKDKTAEAWRKGSKSNK